MSDLTNNKALPDSANKADFYELITEATITAGVVDTNELADGAATTAKIDADAVDGTKIADDAVDSEHIAAGAIDAAHLASDAVETAKIKDANVTTAKLASTTGADTNVVTGTAGTDGNVAKFNGDGDVVDGGVVAADILTGFGSWASKSNNTSYLAATDGFVVATDNDAGGVNVVIKTDSSNPPTTVRAEQYNLEHSGLKASCMCPVKSGDYWKVEINASGTIYWIPLS